jgi:hypothetical protein
MQTNTTKSTRWVYVRRALILSLALGILATTALILLTAAQFGGSTGPGTYHLQFGPVNFFTVIKEQIPGGSTSQLRPGFGILVLNVLLPALTLFLAWRKKTVE